MKTFVAENVLQDYTDGLVVVKAETIEDAMRIIQETIFGRTKLYRWEEGYLYDIQTELRELKDNECCYVYGGG